MSKRKKEKKKKLCENVMFSLFCIVLKIYHILLLNRKKTKKLYLPLVHGSSIFIFSEAKVYFQHDEEKTKVFIFFKKKKCFYIATIFF